MFSVGKQRLVDIKACNPEKLKRVEFISDLLYKAAVISGATIVSKSFKQFEPYGVSGVVIIEESHLTIHTWPEHGFASIDYYSCSDTVDMEKAINFIQEELEAESFSSVLVNRGDIEVESLNKGNCTKSVSSELLNKTKESELNEVVL